MSRGLLAIAISACNSAALHVERLSSGGVDRAANFQPVRGRDGHYITFPAYPFVNCTDALVPGHLGVDGVRDPENGVQASSGLTTPQAVQGIVASSPCGTSEQYRDFLGYARKESPSATCQAAQAPWVTVNGSHQQQTLARLAQDYCVASGGTTWPTTEFSFIQLSDVQIREPSAKLGSTQLSHRLKHLESSFEQDYEQEQYAMFVYDAVVETINAEVDDTEDSPDRVRPSLVIHTGDSVDMGLQSEFNTFITYSDHLHLPWYQAVGNHDVLAFGNLTLSAHDNEQDGNDPGAQCSGSQWQSAELQGVHCTCTNLAALIREENARRVDNRGLLAPLPDKLFSLFPILLKRICIVHKIAGDRFVMDPYPDSAPRSAIRTQTTYPLHAFIDAHNSSINESVPAEIRERYAQQPVDDDHPCGVSDGQVPPEWGFHGFNLERGFDEKLGRSARTPGTPSRDLGGYYCFQMGATSSDPNRKIWAVVLNTTIDAGAYGAIGGCQQQWLEHVLGQQPSVLDTDCPFTTPAHQIGSKDLVLVFSHHPIWSIYNRGQRTRLIHALTTSPNVVAMFTGHTHHPELRVQWPLEEDSKPGHPGHPIWEVIAASLIDYPQQARQITLKTSGDLGYFEILSFAPLGRGPTAELVKAAERGAIRDKCSTSPELCEDGRIRLPGRNVTFPRIFFRMPGAKWTPECVVEPPHAIPRAGTAIEAPECAPEQPDQPEGNCPPPEGILPQQQPL